ncbi:MAG: 50S ribosomal protein L24 [Bacteroidales bacterium]|nr:50S ribosomal protein L24 [Bacteroidales bacterium]
MAKLHIKKGDIVVINAGDDKGKEGKVLSVDPEKQRAVVEGCNIIKKHSKPSASNPQGGIVEKEAPIHISNLNLKDPKTGAATRVSVRVDENGKKVRIAKKSGEEIK